MNTRPIRLALLGTMCLLAAACAVDPSEIISFNDPAFLEALADSPADRNGDGIITLKEAEAVVSLTLSAGTIRDLSGLQHFESLDTLIIFRNPFPEIDLSGNTMLRYLSMTSCELETLDVTANINLTSLEYSGSLISNTRLSAIAFGNHPRLTTLNVANNRLGSVDLSGLPALQILDVGYNELDSLDLSPCPKLVNVRCLSNRLVQLEVPDFLLLEKLVTCGNYLSELDVSGQVNLVLLGVDNMPMLTKVCVWTLPFPPAGVTVLDGFSPNINYSFCDGELLFGAQQSGD